MENYVYIKVADKNGENEAADLLQKLQEGYGIAQATGSNGCVHYVLFRFFVDPLASAPDEDHELDEDDIKTIEESIERGIKEIKNG